MGKGKELFRGDPMSQARYRILGRVMGPPIPEKWKFTKAGPISAALALGSDGVVYAASEDGFLYAVDAAGNLQWKFSVGPMRVAPALGADGTIYVTNEDQTIFAVNRNGTQ